MKRVWLHLSMIAIAAILMHCGHADQSPITYGPGTGGGSGSGQSPGELVKLISKSLGSDERWTYVIGLRSAGITGAKTAPFVMGSFNGWQVQSISDSDGDGFYEVTIISFNKEIKLSYGGDYLAGSWAELRWSGYYSQSDQALAIDLYEGKLYAKGAAPFSPPPGQFGDTFLRFSLDYSQATIYFNNDKVNGSPAHPFHTGSYNNWTVADQTIVNSDGWGYAVINVTYPADIQLGYGGDYAANLWVNPFGSDYYDAAHNNFHFCLKSNPVFAVTPGACP